MSKVIPAYPLSWPWGWKRSATHTRKSGRFSKNRTDVSITEGNKRVRLELDRMGVHDDDIVISSDLRLRLDGMPRGDQKEPADPGVAVYWHDAKGATKVMAIDLYDRVADNLAAVAATLEAMRAIERHGGAAILDRAFTGFTALPGPAKEVRHRPWREVFGFEPHAIPNEKLLKDSFRLAASLRHPDKGGSNADMSEVNGAYAEAKEELGYA